MTTITEKWPAVYILASAKHGTLYVGVTSDLITRMHQHKNGWFEGFAKKYNVKRLVYYEKFDDMATAIERETKLKKWNRAWKIKLIEDKNPDWRDLLKDFSGD
ncbi:MAG: GIY-YIG nuclease family protein [Hydrotalea sp.]|nr:GIY-YIG nuclease family protein [Hydrotalea sp.]